MTSKNAKDLYINSFDTLSYMEESRSVCLFDHFFFRNIHQAFAEGKVRGRSCVDIGSGPTICTVVSASKFCDTIVLSDFLASNRKELFLWLKKDPKSFDWRRILEHFSVLEDFNEIQEGVSKIEARLRKKIKDVVYCDVTQEHLLGDYAEIFDVAITSACLESATFDSRDFKVAVKNVSSIVRKGGKFVMLGFLNGTWYVVNNTIFPLACLTKDDVINALDNAGFLLDEYVEREVFDAAGCDSNRCFFCISTKT